jgi:NurA-like 5'-3' nuclease
MRLGDIKISALKLMHFNDSSIIYENLDDLAKGEYTKEMSCMLDSINRAVDHMFLMNALTKLEAKKATVVKQMPNVMDLPIPEVLARLIPYFIKYELYEEDEPSASKNAYDMFINGITRYLNLNTAQGGIDIVYRVEG